MIIKLVGGVDIVSRTSDSTCIAVIGEGSKWEQIADGGEVGWCNPILQTTQVRRSEACIKHNY